MKILFCIISMSIAVCALSQEKAVAKSTNIIIEKSLYVVDTDSVSVDSFTVKVVIHRYAAIKDTAKTMISITSTDLENGKPGLTFQKEIQILEMLLGDARREYAHLKGKNQNGPLK